MTSGFGSSALAPGASTSFTVQQFISNFTPAGGGPGTVVTINGGKFTGATSVTIGGAAATFTVVSDTVISATVPQNFSAAGPIVVTTPNGTATSATNFTLGPKITSFSPVFGNVDTTVTITGTTFSGATEVRFNGVLATTATFYNDTTITAVVPSGATSGPISVGGPAGTGTSASTFFMPTTVTSFSPMTGYAGQAITITGQNMRSVYGITFNSLAADVFTIDSNTQITAYVPGNAASGPLRLNFWGGQVIAGLKAKL